VDLRERLQRLNRPLPSSQLEGGGSARRSGEPPIEELVPGEWRAYGGSRCFVATSRYPLDHQHGLHRLSEVLEVPAQRWASYVGSAGESLALDQAILIDTETTGLMRGPATVAFMVGVGVFEGNSFCVRQYFMPDYADEEALLEWVAQDLADRSGLVSFNGRSFDWPLLQTRYLLARRQPPRRAEPHLDLLLLARRLWSRTLASCSLSHLEQEVLGVERSGQDVPGYLIPQLYQDYVIAGRTLPMADVFYHNKLDLVSLVTLAGRIGKLLEAPGYETSDAHRDPLSLGRVYEREGHTQEAIQAYRHAIEEAPVADRALARRQLSFLFKRLGCLDEAVALWQQALDDPDLYAYTELAKYYEHACHDAAQAHAITQAALERLRTQPRLGLYAAREAERALLRRLERLQNRLAREDQPVTHDDAQHEL
jgi:hypothetical protein